MRVVKYKFFSEANDVNFLQVLLKNVTPTTPSKNTSAKEPTPQAMTPNTRERKSRLAEDIADFINNMDLNETDQVDVINLALKKLSILDNFRCIRRPTLAGRKLLPFDTRETVWKFWHDNTFESTNSNQTLKLRANEKPRVQSGLDFASSVIIVQQRNRSFYQCIHRIAERPFKELY